MKKMSLIFLVGLLSASCATLKVRTSDSVMINKKGIVQVPVLADLTVNATKASLTKEYGNISIEQAKENAMYDFTKENKCDVIVQPTFNIDAVKVIFGEYDVRLELTGFPANYTNLRNYQPKDSLLLPSASRLAPLSNSDLQEKTRVRKSKVGKVLGIVGGSVLALLVLIGLAR